MRANKPANAGRKVFMAAAMGHPDEVLDRFIAELNIPPSLRLVKIGLESFERITSRP